jgi:BirA family biotin operon repressor/biotin-[acetyl-CoA-carboxylase] ligase
MKYEILNELRISSPAFVSGEALGRSLGVSRTAVWKYVKELKEENYEIEASSRKGYKLVSLPDSPNSYEIGYNLGTSTIGIKNFYFNSLDSTNSFARKLASEGCEDGTVVAAGSQTQGRGRLGRSWESPPDKGIYLTIILRPTISPEEILIITIAASAAAAFAIEKSSGVSAGIKWPNDIILHGKKVCGILTEMNSETDRVNYVICGIGINFSQRTEDFSEDLRDKAVSVMSAAETAGSDCHGIKRLDLIRSVLREFDRVYTLIASGNSGEILRAWKTRSVTLGRDVSILYKDRKMTGRAIDITEDGRLVVCGDDGATREIMSGEVSVRGLLGYT